MNKCYSELLKLQTFKERFEYLKLSGYVGDITFGGNRYFNQRFYKSDQWLKTRRSIILRDNGCDLACPDRILRGNIFIHHINPITIEDILKERYVVFDPENLICSSFQTHNAIHYGDEETILPDLTIRTKNDTCPWR